VLEVESIDPLFKAQLREAVYLVNSFR